MKCTAHKSLWYHTVWENRKTAEKGKFTFIFHFLVLELLQEVLRPPLRVRAGYVPLQIIQHLQQTEVVGRLSEILGALIEPGP